MTTDRSGLLFIGVCAAAAGLMAAPLLSHAQTAAPKPAAKSVKSTKKAAAAKATEFIIPDASAEQIDAAGRVYYGNYDCEFNQSIQIVASAKYASYVDIRHGKVDYLMKPVLSSTGAIRLEDVRGETLMVQIAAKSMLLNVKTGHRLVDDCISPKQRELNEEGRAAKAAAVAAAAAPSALAGATAAPATAPAAGASVAVPPSAMSSASSAPAAEIPAAK